MDAKTIGQKIKERTGTYAKVSDEELGQKYLDKYGWIMSANDIKTSQPSAQIASGVNNNFAYDSGTGATLALRLLGMKAPITQGPGGSYSHKGYTGWDYGVGEGTPLKAAEDVVAEYMPNQGIYGNRMLVTLPNGQKFYISHLSSGKSGQYKKDQEYARSGNTGKSSAPHIEIAPAS